MPGQPHTIAYRQTLVPKVDDAIVLFRRLLVVMAKAARPVARWPE